MSDLPRVRADSVELDPSRSIAVELCLFRLCDYTSADVRASTPEQRDEAYRAHLRAEHRSDLDRLAALAIREPEPAAWVPCSVGTISATRPLGALVRFRDLDGAPQEGTLRTLGASEVSLVYYRVGAEVHTPEGPELLLWDLPLSHPIEILR